MGCGYGLLLIAHDSQIHGIEHDLYGVVQAIREIENASVPINRLPPEILSNVLEHRTGEQDLVAATHVCRHWRSVLISSPSLWNCFRLHSSYDLDRTLTYLERSKSAPIDISISADSPRDLDVLDHLAPQIARTRSLIIRVSHDIHAVFLLLCNSAPSLQHLEIRAFDSVKPLPENFLGRQTPSLRSVRFSCVRPEFESFPPLPNLTEFHLFLPESAGPFHMGALFRFFSDCPVLQKVGINIRGQIVQGIAQGRVISLESLVELEYVCHFNDLILPFLRLPRLKKLWVTSLGPGQVHNLADTLPHDGHTLLAGVTKILYYFDIFARLLRVKLSGNGVDVSLGEFCATDATTVDWLSDQTLIPLGQIEDLKVEGSPFTTGFPISFFALENLRVLRVALWDSQFTEELLRLLHPAPGTGVPCPSLREIEYTCYGPRLTPLTSLIKERKRSGQQLRLLCILAGHELDQDLVEELRDDVGEVRVRGWDERV